MFFKVHGRLRHHTAGAFRRALLDGTIALQEPDGPEIIMSMKRAVLLETGEVEWSEVCYCQIPLQHERATVYDLYFDNLTTEVVKGYQEHEGQPFMDYLQRRPAPKIE